MRTIRRLSTAVVLSIPLALAACSSDDNNPSSPTGSGGNGGTSSSGGAGGSAGSAGSAGSGTAGGGGTDDGGSGGTTGGAGGSTGGAGGGSSDGGAIKVGLITKEAGNPFFLKMKDGAQAEADAKGVTLIATLDATTNAAQVAEIDKQVAAGVKGILLVSADTTAIEPKIAEVQAKGIIVIALDTPTASGKTDALFATDNKVAGKLIGQYAKAALGNAAPKIITLDGPVGLTVSDLRHSGFLEGFYGTVAGSDAGASDAGASDGGASSQVACAAPTMGDATTGQTAAATCLGKVPDVNVIYTVNEPVAAGAYAAMLATDGGVKPANVVMVSVDGGCMGVQLIKDGKLAATSQQYPLKMAKLGVDAVYDFATTGKKPTPYFTDTGVNLITDKPFDAGFAYKDTAFGLMNCWGM